jgi:glycine betaine catabolism B
MNHTLSLQTLLRMPQTFLDTVGMYRVVSGSLVILALVSIAAGFSGHVAYSGTDQLIALALAVGTALLLNVLIAKITAINANHESALITALILFFLAVPAETAIGNWPLLAAVAVGIGSKFIMVYRKQHVVNPAAVGALALSLPGFFVFSWWVANPTLFIPLLLLGSAVIMKVRRWPLVLSFISVGLLTYLFESWRFGEALWGATQTFFISWPTLFLAAFMLTEPFTVPARRWQQVVYGAGVGFLANTTLFMPVVSVSPEFALVIGNLAVAPWRLSQKLFLEVVDSRLVAADIYEFSFRKPAGFTFLAGQYLEWMLPHQAPDSRGVRRYFTIASAPEETHVKVAMKIPAQCSSFKAAFLALTPGSLVTASQCGGDFVLPADVNRKIGFIAGGIGVTPFRSHVQSMLATRRYFDTVLYYCTKTGSEQVFQEEFDVAHTRFSFDYIPVVANAPSGTGETGVITTEMLFRRTPDYKERVWYLSGPPAMVDAYNKLLIGTGVPRRQIKTDFFPGVI